jgi:cell division septum initiation protein DivIVA
MKFSAREGGILAESAMPSDATSPVAAFKRAHEELNRREQMLADAEKKARNMIANAESRAKTIVDDAQRKADDLKSKWEKLQDLVRPLAKQLDG